MLLLVVPCFMPACIHKLLLAYWKWFRRQHQTTKKSRHIELYLRVVRRLIFRRIRLHLGCRFLETKTRCTAQAVDLLLALRHYTCLLFQQ